MIMLSTKLMVQWPQKSSVLLKVMSVLFCHFIHQFFVCLHVLLLSLSIISRCCKFSKKRKSPHCDYFWSTIHELLMTQSLFLPEWPEKENTWEPAVTVTWGQEAAQWERRVGLGVWLITDSQCLFLPSWLDHTRQERTQCFAGPNTSWIMTQGDPAPGNASTLSTTRAPATTTGRQGCKIVPTLSPPLLLLFSHQLNFFLKGVVGRRRERGKHLGVSSFICFRTSDFSELLLIWQSAGGFGVNIISTTTTNKKKI